jgi:MoCo/4Fe-4S cofactor protein with predicted Tat translocation signal
MSGYTSGTKRPLTQITPRRAASENEEARVAAYHELRDRMALSSSQEREYWRSLEELVDTPEFRRHVENEFPEQAAEFDDHDGRRRFLKLMGASLALAGAGAACSYQPTEHYAPYVRQPEYLIQGKALFFATAMPGGPHGGMGLLARSDAGRPTKIEGNPLHPASLGHTDIFAQAAILGLYDPDRSKIVIERGDPSSWSRFQGAMQTALEAERARGGAGLRILTESVHSPTLARQLRGLLAEFPQARWVVYEPAGRDNARQGAILAFGRPLNAVYRFDRAACVLSIDSDFLAARGGRNLRYAHDFIRARTPAGDRPDMANPLGGEEARLYAVECEPTQTGAKADHRLALKPSEVEAFTRALAAAVGVSAAAGGDTRHGAWAGAIARDLRARRGRGAVIVGDAMPPAIHALGHSINAALGNVGATVYYTEPVEFTPEGAADDMAELRNLVGEMNAGKAQTLLILGGNPIFTAPADLGFGEALEKVPLRVHHGLYADETAAACHWHLPRLHFLEEWSDVRAFDGTVSIIQPLINPLYQGRSVHEIIGLLSSPPQANGYEIVRATYAGQAAGGRARATQTGQTGQTGQTRSGAGRERAGQAGASETSAPAAAARPNQTGEGGRITAPVVAGEGDDSEKLWRRILHDGVAPGTASAAITASPTPPSAAGQTPNQAPNQNADDFEIIFRPDPTVYDGRYGNNGWLQELPKPLTTLTWDNAAIVSPRTAERLGLESRNLFAGGGFEVDVVKLSFKGREVEAPVWILPGHPDGAVTVHFGYGRTRAGVVGNGAGYNAYLLRTSDAMWHGSGLRVMPAGRRVQLASTQAHFQTEGRGPVRVATLDEYRADPDKVFAGAGHVPPEDMTMYPNFAYDYHRWGMAIDNNACVGCNACVVACQAENNTPVVGKEQVLRSREMQWLRIDTYYRGEKGQVDDPEGPYFQPLMCVHCEKAPCEPVCPVHATVHDAEGLNVMVYNRCIGTRYCSNNCPYKVRRFNFLLYQDWETEQYKMMRNPEVTVRSRGVMEKCTYCTQRIQEAKVNASKEGRKVRDGEVVTACQAACPTEAIVFGDLNDPEARVTKIRQSSKRGYPLLGELNTRPRTWHLGELRNPNPELETAPRRRRETPDVPVESGRAGGGNG